MQLLYLDLFELCYTDMNSPVGQRSAVASMLQCLSNKQGIMCEINRLVAITPSVAYSKETLGLNGRQLLY